jgi:hypothetical protein
MPMTDEAANTGVYLLTEDDRKEGHTMKSFIPTMALAGLLALAAGSAVAAVTVTFNETQRYSDMPFPTWDRENVKEQLADHFKELGQYLPPGQDLRIDVLDIDLAGRDVPNFRTGNDIRVMTGRADWPRMQLRYALEQNGQVIKSAEVQLQDMNYQMTRNHYFSSEPFRYEKQMIDDWFEKDIAPIRKQRR